jgi:O-acetylserine/cysteine efflux transporter
MTPRDVALAVLAALIWGATFPISALALMDTPPIFFTFLRFAAAAAFILVVPRPAVPWRTLLLVGLLLGAGQYGFMFVSMTQGISAGLASLLVHTQAFFTILIAMVVFAEPLRGRQVFAIGLALIGLALLVANHAEAGQVLGILLVLLAALCGASGNNILKSLGKVDMLGVAVWMSLAVPLPMLALSLALEVEGSAAGLFRTISWTTLGAVGYSAVLATVVVFAIWGRLLASYAAVKVAPFFLLVPVFGLGLSALVLGERLAGPQVAGAALIFLGLCIALWPAHRASE